MVKGSRVTSVGVYRFSRKPYVNFLRYNETTGKVKIAGYYVCENSVKRLVDLLCTRPYTLTGKTVPAKDGWVTTL